LKGGGNPGGERVQGKAEAKTKLKKDWPPPQNDGGGKTSGEGPGGWSTKDATKRPQELKGAQD